VPRTRRVENLRHGALTTTAGTREGSTITVTASPHPHFLQKGSGYTPARQLESLAGHQILLLCCGNLPPDALPPESFLVLVPSGIC